MHYYFLVIKHEMGLFALSKFNLDNLDNYLCIVNHYFLRCLVHNGACKFTALTK